MRPIIALMVSLTNWVSPAFAEVIHALGRRRSDCDYTHKSPCEIVMSPSCRSSTSVSSTSTTLPYNRWRNYSARGCQQEVEARTLRVRAARATAFLVIFPATSVGYVSPEGRLFVVRSSP